MNYKIINDSMLNMLSHIEENSIDCVITDPPYHLTSITKRFGKEDSKEAQFGKDGSFKRLSKGFMGKEWDGGDISFNPETWEKCFKVLKPGGYLLAFGGSRTFHRIACAIEDAGFELRDTIMYLYGSGFPKSMNIGKVIEAKIKTGKSNSRALRQVEQDGNGESYILKGKNNGILGKDRIYERKEFTAETGLAKQWQGYGTALKPAFEPIIMARKPIKTTVADNVINYGVGGINIDECRVETHGEKISVVSSFIENEYCTDPQNYRWKQNKAELKEQGRFPANIIHDGSEEVISGFPNTGPTRPHCGDEKKLDTQDMGWGFKRMPSTLQDDGGSAARFFYTAKASKKDRDEGLESFDEQIKVFNGKSKNVSKDIKDVEKRFTTVLRNIHPTVKPCELMQYLIRLVAPKGATILDPFMGSGSTGKAVMFENRERNADYKFIGIDLEKEYCEIAEMRINYALNKYEYDFKQRLQESKEKGQTSLLNT